MRKYELENVRHEIFYFQKLVKFIRKIISEQNIHWRAIVAKTRFKIGNSNYHAKYPCYWFLVLYDIEKCNIESEIDSFAEALRLANFSNEDFIENKIYETKSKAKGI